MKFYFHPSKDANIEIKSKSNVHVGEYPFHDKIKSELLLVLEKYLDRQSRDSNVYATMTEWRITSPQIERLKTYVVSEIYKYLPNSMVQKGENMDVLWRDFWANIYRKGDYDKRHHHKPSVFSFVYFLKTKWYDSPLVFTDFGEKIRPQEGRFVIFPGFIMHKVPKHRYNESRITLSGNLHYKDVCTKEWLDVPQVDILKEEIMVSELYTEGLR